MQGFIIVKIPLQHKICVVHCIPVFNSPGFSLTPSYCPASLAIKQYRGFGYHNESFVSIFPQIIFDPFHLIICWFAAVKSHRIYLIPVNHHKIILAYICHKIPFHGGKCSVLFGLIQNVSLGVKEYRPPKCFCVNDLLPDLKVGELNPSAHYTRISVLEPHFALRGILRFLNLHQNYRRSIFLNMGKTELGNAFKWPLGCLDYFKRGLKINNNFINVWF